MKLVLDASMALAWFFERNTAEESARAERALLSLADAETWVPALWHAEIANGLLVGERRMVVTQAQVTDYLDRLSRLPIHTDGMSSMAHRDRVMALAREYGLSAYDASYLELALRADSVLATFDGKLSRAMARAGGDVFG